MDQSQKSLSILSDITTHMKYAKYSPELQRRETFEELCNRNMNMHIQKYPQIKDEIVSIYTNFVQTKKVLPSMRSMQFAGIPIERNPTRIYNCSYLPIDHPFAFSEVLFLLLGGTGVGYSVQNHHIEKLPEIRKPNPNKYKRFLIGDSIEGWADSIKVLMKSYFYSGSTIKFDYGDIRPKGARLITAGGKAPGPDPLKECHLKITHILNQKQDGEQLTSLEVHDILCHLADAVLAGGIRRAAMISLFDADDMDMISCKSGNWWELNPQRGRANNSAVLLRNKITKDYFMKLWERIEFSRAGEPGIFFTTDKDWGTNPCFTGDTMIAMADGTNAKSIKELAEYSQGSLKFPVYSGKYSAFSNQYGNSNKFYKWKPEIQNAVAFKSGTKPTVEVLLSNGDRFRCTEDHRLALPNGEYIEAINSVGLELESFFTYNDSSEGKKYRHINSFTNGYAKQHRMIYEFNNSPIQEGFVVDHIVNNFNDHISNLQLLSKADHDKKTAILPSYNYWKQKPSIDVSLKENLRVIEVEYTGEVEDVYDLTVENNNNFYILTSGDDNYINSRGILVHNCAEIALRPFQFCNLCEVNVSDITSQEDLNARVKAASFLGTLQAGYTDFHYLRPIWKKTTEKDALIGVGLTGIGSAEYKKYNMTIAAKIVREENERVAEIIGVNKAARATTVKPSGCMDPETQIITNKGVLTLRQIFELNGYDLELFNEKTGLWLELNEEILVKDENNDWQPISKLFINGISQTYDIETEDGEIVSVTPNHKFLTTNRGWVEAQHLTVDDDILVY